MINIDTQLSNRHFLCQVLLFANAVLEKIYIFRSFLCNFIQPKTWNNDLSKKRPKSIISNEHVQNLK